jgi:MFS family permease
MESDKVARRESWMPKVTESLKTIYNSSQLSLKASVFFLTVMALTYVINAMDRNVFPVLLSWVMKTYGFSLQEAGLLSTVFTLGLGLAGVPTGYLLDRSSRKTVMIVGLIFYSAFTVFTVWSIGFYDMLFYRAMTGIGEGMQVAAVFAAAGSYFYRHRTLVIGVINVAYGLGGFLGPYFGTRLTLMTGDWHTPFYVYGLIGIACAFVAWLILPKIFTDFTASSNEGDSTSKAPVTFDHVPTNLWNRNVVLCAVGEMVTGLTMFSYIGLYPTFLVQQLKYSPMASTLPLAIFGIGAMMAIPIGYLGDRIPQRKILIASFLASMITSYLMFSVCVEPWQQNVLSFFQGMLFSASLFVNLYALIQRCVRPSMVGRASGIHVSSIFLPASVSGFIFASLVKVMGWSSAALIILSIFPVVGIIAMLMIRESQIMPIRQGK